MQRSTPWWVSWRRSRPAGVLVSVLVVLCGVGAVMPGRCHAQAAGAAQTVAPPAKVASMVAEASAWEPMAGSPAVTGGVFHGRRALRMECRFAGTGIERASWDRTFEQNLAGSRGIEFDLYVEDVSPVAYFTCYLHSGRGWYAVTFMPEESGGWERIRIEKGGARIEGEPAGWHRVDRIRLSAWRGDDRDTVFYVAGLEPFGGGARLVIVRNDSAVTNGQAEARAVRQYVETMARFLDELGLEYGVLSDMELVYAPPDRGAVLILPYAPSLPEPAVRELTAFVKGGGKLLACYMMPRALEPLVDIHVGRHMRQAFEGQFASIRPVDGGLEGMPQATAQASWNIHHAVGLRGRGRTVGTWITRDGDDTKLPAVVASPNAVFFSHVLLPDDAANKKQLLLAMLGHLMPEVWPTAARQAIDRAGRFGPFESVEQVLQYVEREMAAATDETARRAAEQAAGQARRLWERARRDSEGGRHAAALDAAATLREKLLDAYCLVQTPAAGEFRAFWCHHAYGVAGMTWDQAIKTLADAGFTAVIVNMLWGGTAFYESDVLPVNEMVAQRGDALAPCVAACKKHGLECHVWKVNFNMGWPTDRAFKQEMQKTGRTQVDFEGRPLGDWLCPSHPANQDLEVAAMVEVVRQYAVDGIHFDYIRYPGPQACFCDGCRQRFERYVGQAVSDWPQDLRRDEALEKRWQTFRQEQITTVVRRVATEARRVRPGIKISAAVFRNWPVDRFGIGQDWRSWCRRGYLDFVCPMDYTTSNALFGRIVVRQRDWAGGVPCYPGIGLSTWPDPTDVARVIDQIKLARQAGTNGFVIFNYGPTEAREVLPRLGMGITRKTPVRPIPGRPAVMEAVPELNPR